MDDSFSPRSDRRTKLPQVVSHSAWGLFVACALGVVDAFLVALGAMLP